ILFDTEGRLRIADFGMARALAEAAWTEPAGALLGTARYAAPEQVKGESVDGRADIYALSVTLIEAVTGKVPFAADTTIATLMARVDRPVEAPPELEALGPVVELGGNPDPSERPDAAAFARALDAAAHELPAPDPLPLVGPPDDVTVVTEDATELGPVPSSETPVVVPGAARRRRRWPWAVLIAALIVLAGVGTAFALTRSAATPTHPMPDVQGIPEAQARAALTPLKVKVATSAKFADNTQAGVVIGQSPTPHTKVHEKSTVHLTVSQGPPPVAVPDLTNLTKAAAIAKLDAAGLAVGDVSDTFSEQIAAGTVLDWNPKGQEVPKHTPIALSVSAGPRPRTVPNLAGQPYAQAAALLQQQGLTPVRNDAFNDTMPIGQVIGTTPAAGASVDRGGKVTVNVSKGPDLVQVPDVTGKSVPDATAAMQAAGLSIGNVFGPPNKKVFLTDPAANTQVKRGSSVNVYTK
ncbi:MAG: PASTA domain-containing protein, partial [Acidimicrobiia bacterium]|nr:PASTA domain-containing protein [Acidimicrobiia bacterium]